MTTQELRQRFYSPDPALPRALKPRFILPEFPTHALLRLTLKHYEEYEVYAHQVEFEPDRKKRLLEGNFKRYLETRICTYFQACRVVHDTVKYCTQDSPTVTDIVRIA